MLMPVLNGSFKQRRRAILNYAKRDLEMGFLLAEFNFEWTLRRSILALSKCPTVVIRERLSRCHGWDAYKEAWLDCVGHFSSDVKPIGTLLEGDSIEDIPAVNIQHLKDALDGRHVLAHGVKGGVGDRFAVVGLSLFLNASDRLQRYAQERGERLFGRRIYRHPKCVDYEKCVDCPYESFENSTCNNRLASTAEECSARLVRKCPFVNERLSVSRRRAVAKMHKDSGPVHDACVPQRVLQVINQLGLSKAKTITSLRKGLLQELELSRKTQGVLK